MNRAPGPFQVIRDRRADAARRTRHQPDLPLEDARHRVKPG
jgi:hypothetical protein